MAISRIVYLNNAQNRLDGNLCNTSAALIIKVKQLLNLKTKFEVGIDVIFLEGFAANDIQAGNLVYFIVIIIKRFYLLILVVN